MCCIKLGKNRTILYFARYYYNHILHNNKFIFKVNPNLLMCEIRVTKEHKQETYIKPNVETKPKMRTKTRLEYIIRNNRMRAYTAP